MAIHSECGGNEDITMGDSNGIPITHVNCTTLSTPTRNFILNDVLCAPSIHKNLLSISQFFKHNQASIEFFPFIFLWRTWTQGHQLHKDKVVATYMNGHHQPFDQHLLHTLSLLPKYLLTIRIDIWVIMLSKF